jgi:hypothetical protein
MPLASCPLYPLAAQSSSSQTCSRHSLVTFSPSSITALGTAKESSPVLPLPLAIAWAMPFAVSGAGDSSLSLLPSFVLLPFAPLVVVGLETEPAGPVEVESRRTSWRTRLISSGKVVHSPVRRRESA